MRVPLAHAARFGDKLLSAMRNQFGGHVEAIVKGTAEGEAQGPK